MPVKSSVLSTPRHFEEMAAAREHIRSEHKIKKDAMVDKAIKVGMKIVILRYLTLINLVQYIYYQ